MKLIHSETGKTISVSDAGAYVLLARGGYTDLNATQPKVQAKRTKTEEQT